MTRVTSPAVLALALACAGPASAATWYVPGVANISGRNGTHFASDLKVLNRGSAPTLLTLELLPLAGAAPVRAARSVAPGETFVSENALLALFGASETAGTLRIDADQDLLIGARTFNDASAAGTFGTALQAIRDRDLLRADDIGHAAWVAESPDSSKGYRTNIGVFLGIEGSEVDVVLFDAANAEKGRRRLAGGPRAFQFSVSDVAPGGLPLGRFELRVRSGKATAFAAVVDNVTGDGIAVPALRFTTSSVAINGVAHTPGREGTYFETDVRLFNDSPSASTVSVTPLGLGSIAAKSVALAPHEVKEIPDILGTLFALPDGSAGALRFTAFGAPVFVLARTSNIRKDGTPGAFGASQQPVPLDRLLAPGSTGTLIGLTQTSATPGYRTNVGFLAGPLGGAARLVLRDREGRALATRDPGIALAPNAWTQPSLADLFTGVAIPKDAALDVVPTSGSLDAFASVIDNGSGDPVVSSVSELTPYFCPAPEVWSFFAESESLPSAGPAKLRWYSNADVVRIAPSGGFGLPGSGSTTVTVAATTTFTLEATNSCGAVTRTLRVVVGEPLVPTVSLSTAGPGELLRITPANVRPEDVTGVVFSFPDDVTFPSDNVFVDASGGFLAVIPLQLDSSAPDGYRQGPCRVSLVLADGRVTPGAAFTIAPLVLPVDPVDGLLAWVDRVVEAARNGTVGISALEGGPGASSVVNARIDALAASLRKAAADIAATGTATVPVVPAVPDGPAPPTTTVTRAQLAIFIAGLDAISSTSRSLTASRRALASIPCLKDDLRVQLCVKASIAGELLDPAKLFSRFSSGLLAATGFPGCTAGLLANLGPFALMNAINDALSAPSLICPLFPIYLDHFSPKPAVIPEDAVSRVALYATLTRLSDQSNAAGQLAQLLSDALLSRYGKLSPQCQIAIGNLVSQIAQLAAPRYQAVLDSILSKLKIGDLSTPSREVQVSRCDVLVDTGSPSILQLSAEGCAQQGDPDYCLRGYSPGGVGVLKVTASPLSFLFKDQDQRFRGLDRAPFPVPLAVGPAAPSSLTSIFSGDARVRDADQLLAPGVTINLDGGGQGPARWTLEARQLAPKAWRLRNSVVVAPTLEGATYLTYFLNTGTFGGTMEAVVDASVSITRPTVPHPGWGFQVSGFLRSREGQQNYGDASGSVNGPTSFSLAGTRLSLPALAAQGQLFNALNCSISVASGETGGPGSCVAKVAIDVELKRVER